MADKEGPQAPVPQGGQDPPVPQNPLPVQNPQDPPPPQNPFLPNAPQALAVPHMPSLNWSLFTPKYSGNSDKYAEAHFLRMNNWMDIPQLPDHSKVQRFFYFSRGS